MTMEKLLDRPRVEMTCYCGPWLRPLKWCPWPGLPDELVHCPQCGAVPKVLHDFELDASFVWNGRQYVTYSPVS